MDKPELESADLKQPEPSVADEAAPGPKHPKENMDSSGGDATDHQGDDLDGQKDSDKDEPENHSLSDLHTELVDSEMASAVETTATHVDEAEQINSPLEPAGEPTSDDAPLKKQDDPVADLSDEETTSQNSRDMQSTGDTDDDSENNLINDLHNELVVGEKDAVAKPTSTPVDEAEESNTDKDPGVETESADQNADDTLQSEKIPAEDPTPNPDADASSDTDTDAENDGTDSQPPDGRETDDSEVPADAVAEEEIREASAPSIPFVKIAVSAILIVAVFSGFFIFDHKPKRTVNKTANLPTAKRQMPELKPQRKEVFDIPAMAAPSIYDAHINKISALRDTLLKKQAEIRVLKQRYQQSIEELEKEILDAQRNGDVPTFSQIAGNQRIAFSLKTIQRRQAYISQLELPFKWVSTACEELLYLKRRVMTDLQVSAVASGIDMDNHVKQMQLALQKYQPSADKLAIDPTDARLESLETIWKRVQEKQKQTSSERAYSQNQMISEQICAGNFQRLGELSEISVAAAKCITQMQGSDLFLNRIRELSPGAAKQLCQWKGRWICMNGIRALSPRVSHYLFQWDGNLISLNGLTEFPAEIGESLLNWGGEQLELMGLLDSADSSAKVGIEYLAQWERSGGKLFVPPNLRKKIDALHAKHG